MDFSFLNAAHTDFRTIIRSVLRQAQMSQVGEVFQGFDFGMETFDGELPAQSVASPSAEPRTMIKSRKNFIKNLTY
jgi:2-oxoglutarate dehydrogenase E1 component